MEELVRFAKVLSDENRVKILALIKREGEVCVCEICDTLNLVQPLVSRHLKQMKEVGAVKIRQVGKWTYYSLNLENNMLKSVLEFLDIKLPKLVACDKKV